MTPMPHRKAAVFGLDGITFDLLQPWLDEGRLPNLARLLAEGAGVIVACGEGALCITELQKPGGRRLSAADFLRGAPIAAGSRFD